jgi:hypothetical protein
MHLLPLNCSFIITGLVSICLHHSIVSSVCLFGVSAPDTCVWGVRWKDLRPCRLMRFHFQWKWNHRSRSKGKKKVDPSTTYNLHLMGMVGANSESKHRLTVQGKAKNREFCLTAWACAALFLGDSRLRYSGWVPMERGGSVVASLPWSLLEAIEKGSRRAGWTIHQHIVWNSRCKDIAQL